MKRYILIFIIELCFGFITQAQSVRSFWPPVYQPVDSLILLLEQTKGYEKTSIRQKWVQQLYDIALEHPRRPVFYWRALFWDARNQKAAEHHDKAYELMIQADSLVDPEKYPYDYQRIHGKKLSWKDENEENLFQSYKIHTEQLAYYQSVGDLISQAEEYTFIGNILCELNEFDQALKNLQKSQLYFQKGGGEIQAIKVKLNIANCYFELGKQKEAIAILRKLEKDFVSRQDTSFRINILLSLTKYLSMEDETLLQPYVKKLHKLAAEYKKPKLYAKSEINLAAYYFSKKEYEKSLNLYRNSLLYADTCWDASILLPCLSGIAGNFMNTRQWDSAAIYLNTYNYYRDSIERANRPMEIKQMEELATIKEYERQIHEEKEKARTHQLIVSLITTLLLLILGIFCYILWNRQQKERMKKQLKEAENKELSARLENERLQNLQRQMEIEAQNRQLTLNAMILSEKTSALKAVQEQILTANERKEIHSNIAKEMDIQIKMHLEDHLNWKSFHQSFEKVYPRFFIRLKQLYPSLTEYELRLCAFIRTGMESKQIAHMLNVQPDSIKKARQRLRKKLLLEPDQSLENFLRIHPIQ